MLSDNEIRSIAQRVVNESKRTAHVDTGALRRSISYTFIKGLLTFRELDYGQYNDNSKLEKNAARMIPYGTKYQIIYTEFGTKKETYSGIKQGRASQGNALSSLLRVTTSNIRKLLNRGKETN